MSIHKSQDRDEMIIHDLLI